MLSVRRVTMNRVGLFRNRTRWVRREFLTQSGATLSQPMRIVCLALSIDTNIFVYALNKDSDVHEQARSFLRQASIRSDVVISELVLVELYLLIRNPTVFPHPYDAPGAAAACQSFRTNPSWQIVECRPVMKRVWHHASRPGFPRRRIIDLRLAYTLHAAGVDTFATRNVSDFTDLELFHVFDPLQTHQHRKS